MGEAIMKTKTRIITVLGILLLLSINVGFAQQASEKVHWMVTTEVSLGNLPEFHSFMATELAPLMEKHGYKPVVAWQTIIGDVEEVISVSEFENMAAYHKARVSLLTSEEWKSASKKFDSMVKSTKTRFLSATPYSKLK
jgi:hypothetical protein